MERTSGSCALASEGVSRFPVIWAIVEGNARERRKETGQRSGTLFEMTMRVLLTGFQPFGGHRSNPSEQVVSALASTKLPGITLHTLVLPVSWRRTFPLLREHLTAQAKQYDAVLCLGLAANRSQVEFERFAVNWRSAVGADEDGDSVAGDAIEAGGPAACASTADVDLLAAAAREAGVPAGTSNHAGTFLCNDTYYRTLRHFEGHRRPCAVVFVHLPPTPDMAAAGGSLTLAQSTRGIAAALARLATTPRRPEPTAQQGR